MVSLVSVDGYEWDISNLTPSDEDRMVKGNNKSSVHAIANGVVSLKDAPPLATKAGAMQISPRTKSKDTVVPSSPYASLDGDVRGHQRKVSGDVDMFPPSLQDLVYSSLKDVELPVYPTKADMPESLNVDHIFEKLRRKRGPILKKPPPGSSLDMMFHKSDRLPPPTSRKYRRQASMPPRSITAQQPPIPTVVRTTSTIPSDQEHYRRHDISRREVPSSSSSYRSHRHDNHHPSDHDEWQSDLNDGTVLRHRPHPLVRGNSSGSMRSSNSSIGSGRGMGDERMAMMVTPVSTGSGSVGRRNPIMYNDRTYYNDDQYHTRSPQPQDSPSHGSMMEDDVNVHRTGRSRFLPPQPSSSSSRDGRRSYHPDSSQRQSRRVSSSRDYDNSYVGSSRRMSSRRRFDSSRYSDSNDRRPYDFDYDGRPQRPVQDGYYDHHDQRHHDHESMGRSSRSSHYNQSPYRDEYSDLHDSNSSGMLVSDDGYGFHDDHDDRSHQHLDHDRRNRDRHHHHRPSHRHDSYGAGFIDHPHRRSYQRSYDDNKRSSSRGSIYSEGHNHGPCLSAHSDQHYHHRRERHHSHSNTGYYNREAHSERNEYHYYNDETYSQQQPQQRPQSLRDNDDEEEEDMVEVTPGTFVKLRGSIETWRAIQCRKTITATCFSCMIPLVCVDDAEMVMCPVCRDISPVIHDDDNDACKKPRGGGGLGLGMTEEEASKVVL